MKIILMGSKTTGVLRLCISCVQLKMTGKTENDKNTHCVRQSIVKAKYNETITRRSSRIEYRVLHVVETSIQHMLDKTHAHKRRAPSRVRPGHARPSRCLARPTRVRSGRVFLDRGYPAPSRLPPSAGPSGTAQNTQHRLACKASRAVHPARESAVRPPGGVV